MLHAKETFLSEQGTALFFLFGVLAGFVFIGPFSFIFLCLSAFPFGLTQSQAPHGSTLADVGLIILIKPLHNILVGVGRRRGCWRRCWFFRRLIGHRNSLLCCCQFLHTTNSGR